MYFISNIHMFVREYLCVCVCVYVCVCLYAIKDATCY